MTELTLVEAWTYWRQATPLTGHTLWGEPILWLGRYGKIAQFFGAALIIVEIIGKDKINKLGNKLANFLASPAITSPIRTAWNRAMRHWQVITGKALATSEEMKEVSTREVLTSPRYLLELLLLFVALYFVWTCLAVTWMKVIAVIVVTLLWAFIGPIASLVVILLLAAIPWLFLILLRAIAWVMSQPSLDTAAKVLALLLVIVGFHFDLLAS